MKHILLYMLLIFILSCSNNNSNPIITEFNQIPDFRNLEQHHITEARQIVESKVSTMIEDYKSIPNEARTFENTLAGLDDIYDQLYDIRWPFELIDNRSPR